MYRYIYFSCTIFFFIFIGLLPNKIASAATITAPSSAGMGQEITATLMTEEVFSLGAPLTCTMQITFGDGSQPITVDMHNAGTSQCQGSGPALQNTTCRTNVIHSYGTAGIYVIRARPLICRMLNPPLTPLSRITITAPTAREIDLPDGVVGMDYTYELGDRQNRYLKTTGRMDSGLKIVRNKINGVPVREGKYRFQIRTTDPRTAITTDTWYNLKVTKALLKVTVDPKKAAIDRNRAETFRLRYTFSASEEINDVLESGQGIFFAGSRRIGTVNARISTKMVKGKAQLNEQVTVPLAVIKTAQRMGIDQIRYQRTFTARFMDKSTTSSVAVAVGTGFTFTRIRIYFADDKNSKKFVKRNQKGIRAKVELRYEGAGLLKGYWQADDRILARVTKNLPFANARTTTLSLPKVPPLPTHSIGSHRLRFVITNPPMRIPFPQVIYIVTGEDLATVHPIRLISPKGRQSVQENPLSFSWQSRHEVALYKVELFKGKGKKQTLVFSAFSKKTTYILPENVQSKKLHPDAGYFWRVTGLDRNNKPVAQSKVEKFTVGQAPLSYVPGRLLLLMADQSEHNNTLIDRLIKKYNLTLKKKKVLPGIDRELVLVTTTEDVEALSRRIGAENKAVMVQPDYFYSTLGEIVETANLKALLGYLHLQNLPAGKGRLVAVIDTGIDISNNDLAANLALHVNFVDHSPYRGEIHGTAIAGIIAARQNGRGTAGIAPQSRLLGLRACEQLKNDKAAGRCYSSSIIQALDRAMTEKAEIVNMSIGTAAPDKMVATALDRVADKGALLLAPAGNDPARTALAFPASHPRVISVAGILENGRKFPNKQVADKSDCILPAQNILATLPGGRVGFMNGTSMASAEAAGLLAVLHPGAEKIKSCRNTGRLITCLSR